MPELKQAALQGAPGKAAIDEAPRSTRRGLLAGAGAVGALAAAAAALPLATKPDALLAKTAAAGAADEHDGYRLSEHVKRYYSTARV